MNAFVFNVKIDCPEMDYAYTVELVANWSYTPFSAGAREDGVPIEPDEPECFEVDSIAANDRFPSPVDVDIAEELTACGDFDKLIEAIKEDCAE